MTVVVLDSGPLGSVTNPRNSASTLACQQWLQSLDRAGVRVILPEIADYEVRRELLRARKKKGLANLDALAGVVEYLPLTTAALRRAAEFWARARQQGRPTSADHALDADVIVAAQAALLNEPGVVVATTNVGHIARFVAADLWQNITP